MTNRRILFVDDEQAVLDGLARALYKERRRWDMSFATGGAEALAMLEQTPFDVVVSDMRMPGMDGAAFLASVRTWHPSAARILLTGGSDGGSVTRALAVAHQFLAKPCPIERLRSTVERTCELQALLASSTMAELTRGVDTLPSTPAAHRALVAAVDDPATTIEQFVDIVQGDVAMTVRVLQLANSSFLDPLSPVTSVRQAVELLGSARLREASRSKLGFVSDGDLVDPAMLDTLRSSSVRVARLARRIVDTPLLAEDAFTAGLVHDVGWLVLALKLPQQLAEILRIARVGERPIQVIEREILGATHAEVGAHLLGTWGLPYAIVEAAAYHHDPSVVARAELGVMGAVHVADALIDGLGVPSSSRSPLDEDFVARLGLAGRVDEWCRLAAEVTGV